MKISRHLKTVWWWLTLMVPAILAAAGPLPDNLLQRILAEGVASGKPEIKIPAGRYEIEPEDGIHLLLQDLHNVTIDATGVELVCLETTLAVQITGCHNITLKGLTIDYDPLPFTQGVIIEISEDRKEHIIEVMEGFPPAESAYVFKHCIYKPDGDLRFGSYYRYELEALEGNRVRVYGLNESKDGGEQIGDIAVLSAKSLKGRYRPHAVFVANSTGTVLEDITLFSSPCFGFFEESSDGSIYRNCRVDRRAGRVHSLNADAFHSKHAQRGPQILDCYAMWQGDDAVNICGAYHFITASSGDRLRVVSMGKMTIQQGDPVQLVTREGRRLDDAMVLSIRPAGSRTVADGNALSTAGLLPKVIAAMRGVYEIQLDRAADLSGGSLIGSNNRMGNGFVVRNCQFGNNRSRGILIKASDGEISGNTLTRCGMQGIKVAPEYYWLESGFSRNLKIHDNTIINPGAEAIQIRGTGPFPGHENLVIENNSILSNVEPAILFNSVRNGSLRNNSVHRLDGSATLSPLLISYGEGNRIGP